jgi:hypothetical protein
MTKLISLKEYNKLMDKIIENNNNLPIDELLILLLDTCSQIEIKEKEIKGV